MGSVDVALIEQSADFGQRVGADPAVHIPILLRAGGGSAHPERFFIDDNAFAGNGAENRGAECPVADWQRARLPLRVGVFGGGAEIVDAPSLAAGGGGGFGKPHFVGLRRCSRGGNGRYGGDYGYQQVMWIHGMTGLM